MNRLHVHLHVRDIAESVRFYSALFGAEPAKRESTTPNGCWKIRA